MKEKKSTLVTYNTPSCDVYTVQLFLPRARADNSVNKAAGNYSFEWTDTHHSCDICGRRTTSKCSICNRDYFCSDKCEAKRYGSHLFTCAQRPLTSADYLWKSLAEDIMPQEPDLLEDFGFNNVMSDGEKHMLLGVYQGLYLGGGDVISAETLHDWRAVGILEDKIKEFHYAIPENSRGGYFSWLMRNPHVLKQPLTKDESQTRRRATYFDNAKSFLDPEDRSKTIDELEPFAKQHSNGLVAMILHRNTPNPRQMIYYSFGFVTCRQSENMFGKEESILLRIYQLLLVPDDGSMFYKIQNRERGAVPPATFTQFWKAYEEGTLIQLMDAKGLNKLRSQLPHLEHFLSMPPFDDRDSVWDLKHFIELANPVEYPPTPSVQVNYGFIKCETSEERAILTELYSRLLASVSPLELHEASMGGRLWEFANEHFPMEEEWRRLTRNHHQVVEQLDITARPRLKEHQRQVRVVRNSFLCLSC